MMVFMRKSFDADKTLSLREPNFILDLVNAVFDWLLRIPALSVGSSLRFSEARRFSSITIFGRRTATHLSFYVGPPLFLRQAAPGSQKLRAAARLQTGQTGKILPFPACL